MSGLTTHVLDTMHGRPAAGMSLRLCRGAETLVETVTNLDGRADKPLLGPSALKAGNYRLEFDVGEYFRDMGAALGEPSFLETVVIDFHVSDPRSHYHVPLLVSPFAYSTYRGS
jgi:5-hydroxyisourate hydrolase